MQAYSAYFKNGRIIPVGNPKIPEDRRIIITVLDESVSENRAEKQLKALKHFWNETKDNGEFLDEEFDKIINNRVNISREIDL